MVPIPLRHLKICCSEVVEAIEAAEADEVVEAAEVLMPGKSLMRTSVSSRFWISALF